MIHPDLATRAYDHGFRLDPVVRSLLDTDFYKLLMAQTIFRRHRDTSVTFGIQNRSHSVRLADFVDVGELRGLALQLRGLRGDDLHLLTVPTSGTGRSADGQSTVVLDEQGADELWASMREGTVEQWLADHRDLTLGERVD